MLVLPEITSFMCIRLKFESETEICYISIHFTRQKRGLG